jgi:hypothetical protein
MGMTDKDLLNETEDLIRTAPATAQMASLDDATLDWLGRVEATFQLMPGELLIPMHVAVRGLNTFIGSNAAKAETDVRRLLRTARWTYRQLTGGPTSLAVDSGMVFDYFNGVSKVIAGARQEVFFVDPYLDGEFVERFLPSVDLTASVRLLGRERKSQLRAAAEAFSIQHKRNLEVRSAPGFHDRFVFIDRMQCFQSGASFKDGAKKTPTTLTEITDAFAEVLRTYENLWSMAEVDYVNPMPVAR